MTEHARDDAAIDLDIKTLLREHTAFEPNPLHAKAVRDRIVTATLVTPTPWLRLRWFAMGTFAAAAMAALVLLWLGPWSRGAPVGATAVTSPPAAAPTAPVPPTPATAMLGDQPEQRRSVMRPRDGAWIEQLALGPDERVRIDGIVDIDVERLAPGERFRVIADNGEVEVRGTAFSVEVRRGQLHQVVVTHGLVEVRLDGLAPRPVAAGQTWTATTITSQVDPGAPARSSKPGLRSPSLSQPTGATATSGSPPTPDAAAVPGSTPQALQARDPNATVATPLRDNEVLFDRGWAALQAGDARAAAGHFEAAAKARPGDALAEDAWFWRASALARIKAPSASAALATFIRGYPNSPRVGEARAMLGWRLIESDPAQARPLFEAAARDRGESVRRSAQRGLRALEQKEAGATRVSP